MKNREIDLLIVVNMFLTGFDATTLNTLWVDKNLRNHGLLQAFSRTNRILNSVKAFGNIICFRDLEEATNKSLTIFGDRDACGIVLLKSYEQYYNGWDENGIRNKGYKELIDELNDRFPFPIIMEGEKAEKEFITLWGNILRINNILTSFDEFEGNEIISERDFQDYQSKYLDLYDQFRNKEDGDKEDIIDDIIFEIELVKQITVDMDYILNLVAEYHQSSTNKEELRTRITKSMESSIELRSKRELIERFIDSLNNKSDVHTDWPAFARKCKEEELNAIIEQEGLKPDKTRIFIENAFQDGELRSTGTGFAEILPPISMFGKDNMRERTKTEVLNQLMSFFEKYFGI